MTRKEWVKQHYPGNVNDKFIGGILGCPYKYPELCKLDPKIEKTMICPGIRRGSGSGVAKCDECWNTPLPNEQVRPSDQVEIRKTMGEPHIKVSSIPLFAIQLVITGFIWSVSSQLSAMMAINDTMVNAVII